MVTRLDRMATHKLVHIWGAPHQEDIVIRAATNEIDNGAFYKTAHAFSVHLQQQNNLILEMQAQWQSVQIARRISSASYFSCLIFVDV